MPNEKPLKIAMFTNNFFPFIGGVPISIHRLTKGLRGLGHDVYIFAPKYPHQEKDSEPYIVRFKLLVYLKAKLFHFPIVNIFSTQIDREFAKYDFDLIHAHHPFWMGKKALSLGRKYNIPVVLTFHTRYDRYYKNLPMFKLLFRHSISHQMVKLFSEQCESIIAPTETAKRYLEHLKITRPIDILPTGVELKDLPDEEIQSLRRQFVPDDNTLLCSVSRLATEKNLLFLIDCIDYVVHHTAVKFQFIMVGDGPEKSALLDLIQRKNLQDVIRLIGNVPVDEVHKYYLASDIFVFTSKSETQGMVLVEAMTGRCPIIAVSAGGVDDVVIDDYNGYKTLEDVTTWGNRLIELLEYPDKLKTMAENAYAFSTSYSLEAIAIQAEKIYKREVQKIQHENITG